MNNSAFVSHKKSSIDNISILEFYINSSYEIPLSLITSNIDQFQYAISFASKLIEMERSIEDEYTRNKLFADYLKGIEQKHSQELRNLEKKSLSDSTSIISPILKQIEDIKADYEQQIKQLQKANKILEIESVSSKNDIESVFQKEIKQLNKRIAELEVDLAKSNKSDSLIREQCQVESDRLINAIKESSRELIKVKEDALQHKETILNAREEELSIKLQRNSSSAYRGQDGENYFSKVAKEKMNWDFEYTGDRPHSCDYSSIIQGISTFFELKNYTQSIAQKEVTKFLRDMKEHPEVIVGIFVSLNTPIAGKPKNTPISIDWIHGNQCVLYIQSCLDLDIDLVLSTIDQVVRISGIFSRVIKSHDEGTKEHHYQMRIDNAKLYVHNSILRTSSLIRKIQADKKQQIETIETNSMHSINELKQQSSELETAMQLLLNEYTDNPSDEIEISVKPLMTTKEKSKKKERKVASK